MVELKTHRSPALVLCCSALTCLVLLFGTIPPSHALVGDTYGTFGLDGSLRVIGAAADNYDFEPLFKDSATDGFLQEILRLTAMGRPGDGLSYQLHLVHGLTHSSGGGSPGGRLFNFAGGDLRYRAADLSWDWITEDRTSAGMWVDRMNVRLSLPWADFTLGRQAVTFGKAHFWNPLDVYLPFDPRQFDRDYKPGVDALRCDLPLGPFSGLTLLGVAGRELDLAGQAAASGQGLQASWYGSSILARAFTTLGGWDLALQGGKIYGGWQLGGGLVGELGPVQVRAEAAWFRAQDSPSLAPLPGDLYEDHLTAVLGLSRRFESSLILEMEYLYNGAGESSRLEAGLARFQNGASLHVGQNLLGALASYELSPLVTGSLAAIVSLTDGSLQVQPTLTISASDNTDIILGASLNTGRRPKATPPFALEIKSEFGTYPNVLFGEIKVYF